MTAHRELFSTHLPPEPIDRLRALSAAHRVSMATIVRDVLPRALDRWEMRQDIRETKRELRRELARPTRWVSDD